MPALGSEVTSKPSLTVGLLPRGNDEVLPESPVNAGRGSSPTVREGSIKSYRECHNPRGVVEANGSQRMTSVEAPSLKLRKKARSKAGLVSNSFVPTPVNRLSVSNEECCETRLDNLPTRSPVRQRSGRTVGHFAAELLSQSPLPPGRSPH